MGGADVYFIEVPLSTHVQLNASSLFHCLIQITMTQLPYLLLLDKEKNHLDQVMEDMTIFIDLAGIDTGNG